MKFKSVFFLIISVLILQSLSISCKAEDEEPPKYSPLLTLLQVNVIEGIQYNGNSYQSQCNGSPLLANCLQIGAAEKEIFKTIDTNTYLTLTLRDNVISGKARILAAHFDLTAHVFEFSLTGRSVDDSSGKKILTLDPLNDIGSQNNPDYKINLTRMQLEMDNTAMTGAMNLNLTKTGTDGYADIVYSVKVNKVL
jgi:hypothetical protein